MVLLIIVNFDSYLQLQKIYLRIEISEIDLIPSVLNEIIGAILAIFVGHNDLNILAYNTPQLAFLAYINNLYQP